ncbi:MAG TPA: NusG domain II-containing protein [Spirochaetales bacterium]|nr:NusG domain II-containing protein [Spirochaetales bacterium]
MIRHKPSFTLLDGLIILLAAFAFGYSALVVYGGPAPSSVVVSAGGKDWVYPLSENREFAIQGPLGITRIRIHDGSAYFTESPCDNKTCLSSAHAHASGDWIACLPNGVFLRVEGDATEGQVLDAIVR